MPRFELPANLKFNRGMIQDPGAYAKESGCESWLFLVGDEFASMPGGITYEQVQAAAPVTARVVSDPPRVMSLDLARQHVAALDALPSPTLISCRSGPRASAVAYMYAGLKQAADPADVLAAAERDGAPFYSSEELRTWVVSSMEDLRATEGQPARP